VERHNIRTFFAENHTESGAWGDCLTVASKKSRTRTAKALGFTDIAVEAVLGRRVLITYSVLNYGTAW